MKLIVKGENKLAGEYFAPPSKSHSFRSLILSLHSKQARIDNLLMSDDIVNFLNIIKTIRNVKRVDNGVEISAVKKRKPKAYYNFQNSGTALRFFTTYLALIKDKEQKIIIDGDEQLRKREIKPLLEALSESGLEYGFCLKNEIPFYIKNTISPQIFHIYGKSSQFLSSLLLNLPFLKGKSVIKVGELNEKPYIDMTIWHLSRVGITLEYKDYSEFTIKPVTQLKEYYFNVSGDYTSAGYFILASVLTQSELKIRNLLENDVQGDKNLIYFLENLGVKHIFADGVLSFVGDITKGASFNLNSNPDLLPSLVFFFMQYPYEYEFKSLEPVRKKETDRVKVLYDNLLENGFEAEMTESKLRFKGNPNIKRFFVNAHNDHRIIMGGALLGLKKGNSVEIINTENISSSYPYFVEDMKSLGVNIFFEN